MNNIEWLQKFYLSNCDGDWEHGWGVEIGTLDNPGWRIKVNLSDTLLDDALFNLSETERDENDWVHAWVDQKVFHAAGGPLNLDEMIGIFRSWAEQNGIVIEE